MAKVKRESRIVPRGSYVTLVLCRESGVISRCESLNVMQRVSSVCNFSTYALTLRRVDDRL